LIPLPVNADPQAPPHGSTSELIPAALRFARVLRRRRHVVINCLMLTAALGIAYYAVATRLYESSARLLIIKQKHDEIASVDQESSDTIMATHRALVTSPVVIEGAIARLAPADRIDLVDRPPQDWVRTLAGNLSASNTRRTNLIDVSYRSRRPQAAAAVVRAVIESYLDFVRKNHQGNAGELKSVLSEGCAKIAQDLAARQQRLQAFRQEHGQLALPVGEGVVDPMVQRALSLNDSLMEAQRQRLELQSTLASIDDALARGEDVNQHLAGVEQSVGEQMMLSALGMSAKDMDVLAEQEKRLLAAQEELQNQSAFLGPNHPRIAELEKQIAGLESYLHDYRLNLGQTADPAQNAERGAVVRGILQQAVRQGQERERQLSAAFAAARDAAAAHSGNVVQLQMLEREVERAEKLHDLLCEKIANVDFRQDQAPLSATVVSEPLAARSPASPRLRLVVLACLVGGFGVGACIVYVQDVLDDRFDSPEELTAQLGVPVLALVRELEPIDAEGFAGVHAHAMPASPAAEPFRTLRTALTLGAADSGRLLVSSSEPGDGKTTVTVNLAVAFAQSGKRTLVIDADLRKPGLTTRLAMKSLAGLADVLAVEGPVGETAGRYVQHTPEPRLDVLPTGMRRPNPAELLGSPKLDELLAWAESQYDQVLVDCPPVLAVSDAQIVGRLVDGVLLVVRPEKNHRRQVMRAVDSFLSTGRHIFGVVANGISAESDDYGYGYGYGYGHDEAAETGPPVETPFSDQPTAQEQPQSYAFAAAPPPTSTRAEHAPPAIRPRRVARAAEAA
jgi:capsular exopolysaccharide synthesis family protein